MSKIVRLRGIQEDQTQDKTFAIDKAKIVRKSKGRVRLGVSRDVGEIIELSNMQADDIACVEYSNGFKQWIRVDELYRENAARKTRGITDLESDVWEIEPRPPLEVAERGIGRIAIEALEFFGIDLKEVTATKLCEWFEVKNLQDKTPGIYQLGPITGALKLNSLTTPIAKAAKPILFFIHGTGSSSKGGFGDLWETINQRGESTRKALSEVYGDACFAFEHRTLTQSPIDNALDLARALPEDAELHIVTHSRGGLVGELLCLGLRITTADPINEEFLNQIFDSTKDQSQGELMGLGYREPKEYIEQKEKLIELLGILDQKKIKVTRFVRIACPARGTTLASGRLDRWLSILQFLSGSNDFVEFLLGVLKERTDPRSLPGLEAMMPGSALVRLLNFPELKTTADLSVIAGDVEGDSVWNRLKLLLVDWFYSSDHDLVVNTGSMYGGIVRSEGKASFFLDQGMGVNHFNYFKNDRTVEQLKNGLLRPENQLAGYQPIALAKHEEPKRGITVRSVNPNDPLAIVLHGTMGSHLAQDNDRIWLNFIQLAKGRLAELGITMPRVESQGLLNDFYGDFVDYLAVSHRVVPFHYDWRLSIIDSAEMLSKLLESRLPECEAKRLPIRFVAHSMGGLVVRVMFRLYPQLWHRFQSLPGSRLLMLGTPNAGSYEAVRWLTGWNPTLGKLSWLDIAHDTAGLVNIVNRYPGLLELLPSNDDNDYTSTDLWRQVCSGGDKHWPLPQADKLSNLAKTWQLIREAPVDSERMLYVAGWAPETVCDFENISGRGLFSKTRPPMRFFVTTKGDGTVPWTLGRLPGVRTWYVEQAAHDQLLSHRPAFPGYVDLLLTGATSRLPEQEPAVSQVRDARGERTVLRAKMPDSLPSENDLSSFVFGIWRPLNIASHRSPRVSVSVRHGNLAYARYPICVGHYEGDSIVSAEAYLDNRLNGALSKRVTLGLYPGKLNSHEIFIHQEKYTKPNGAIVIGLGRVGELSPGKLTAGVGHALLDYALKINEWPDDRFGKADAVRSAKVSFLLIGTGFGGISIRDSIEAILTGVKTANEHLAESHFDEKVLIEEIEFLELYQDLAIIAARELEAILQNSPLKLAFQCMDSTVQIGQGGYQRVLFEADPNWWHRLEISFDKKYQLLRYIALTDRARAEVTLVSSQMQLADKFISEMITQSGRNRKTAETLFEIMIPNRLKELAPNKYNLVLILDEKSASYPWELMTDSLGESREPAAVAAGMLRQLKAEQFRARPMHTSEKSAFVIGNPLISVQDGNVTFPDLPGAAQEGEAVANLLASNGYSVNKSLGSRSTDLEARDILTGLHSEAYRILHLAGHGVHEYEIGALRSSAEICLTCEQKIPEFKKRISGMVIGDDIFLTPGDVEQMRWVPELVFINCCHLGSTEIKHPSFYRFNELAANLGTQFINMGVKAVIAAGWTVDDAAAKAFAEAFYRAMMTGQSFGYSVMVARQHVYAQYPDVNTWGAYQCYGDPDFRLFENSHKGASNYAVYHAKSEWVSDLQNLISMLNSHDNKPVRVAEYEQKLDNFLKRVPADKLENWQEQADVAATLGIVYGEMEQYERAIELLNKAIAANTAEFPVKALEQRANFRVKHAMRFQQALSKDDVKTAIDEIQTAIQELEILNNFSSTIERLALLGSAYKRLAMQQKTKSRKVDALKKMCDFYQLAFEMGQSEGKLNSYPLTNWFTAEAILRWIEKKPSKTWKDGNLALLSKVLDDAKHNSVNNPGFWNSIVEPDCALVSCLIDEDLNDSQLQDVVHRYQQAMERGASYKDRSALLDHLEFLIVMAKYANRDDLSICFQGILNELR